MKVTEKQIEDIKEIILELKKKNDDLTLRMDDLLTKTKITDTEFKKNIEYSKEQNKKIALYKSKMSKDKKEIFKLTNIINNEKKEAKVFNIILTIIIIIFILIEFYIFIL